MTVSGEKAAATASELGVPNGNMGEPLLPTLSLRGRSFLGTVLT